MLVFYELERNDKKALFSGAAFAGCFVIINIDKSFHGCGRGNSWKSEDFTETFPGLKNIKKIFKSLEN